MHKALRATLATVVVAGTAYMVHHANATQTNTGEAGGALNPTAEDGMTPGSINAQAVYFNLGKEKGTGPSSGPAPSPTPTADQQVGAKLLPQKSPLQTYRFKYYGVHGVTKIDEHWEVSGGVSRLRVSGPGKFNNLTKTGLNLGFKYIINPDAAPGEIKYAVGAGYDRALLKNWRAYAVASKAFVRTDKAPYLVHLGVRWDRFDLDDVNGDDSSKFSAYAAGEVPITSDGRFAVTGEIQSKNNEFPEAKIPYSIGVKFQSAGKKFTVAAGLQRQGLIGDEGFYATIGYRFR